MDSKLAADQLQTIRTLMERSAVYRRALAPIMLFAGLMGFFSMAIGYFFKGYWTGRFCQLWFATALLVIIIAFLIARKQAKRDGEIFWSPPARRAGPGTLTCFLSWHRRRLVCVMGAPFSGFITVYLGNVIRLRPARGGIFYARGIRWFGWFYVLTSCLFFALYFFTMLSIFVQNDFNLLMGLGFGGPHLAYGTYLYFTGNRKSMP